MSYTKLELLRDELLRELQKQTESATTEEQMEELNDIAVDIMDGIPTSLIAKDFMSRHFVKGYLHKKNQRNMKMVDDLMNKCWQNDLVILYDQEFEEKINEIVDEIEGVANVFSEQES